MFDPNLIPFFSDFKREERKANNWIFFSPNIIVIEMSVKSKKKPLENSVHIKSTRNLKEIDLSPLFCSFFSFLLLES